MVLKQSMEPVVLRRDQDASIVIIPIIQSLHLSYLDLLYNCLLFNIFAASQFTHFFGHKQLSFHKTTINRDLSLLHST